MSKLGRKMFRNSAKDAYKKYCREFSRIKEEQLKMSRAARIRAMKNGTMLLGNRLTFNQWLEVVRQPSTFNADAETIQEHVESLEWDE